MQVKGLSF